MLPFGTLAPLSNDRYQALQDVVFSRLQTLAGDTPCAACGGQRGYVIDPGYAQLPLARNGSLALPEGQALVLPLVVLSCGECGHTLLFNAATLGVSHLLGLAP